jgi:hypothetical protein
LDSPDDVAVEAAWCLSRLKFATGAMVARICKQRAIDWLRTYGRDGRSKFQRPAEICINALPPHEHLIQAKSSSSCSPKLSIAAALRLATPGQKACILAIIKRNGHKAMAARDLRVTPQCIDKHLSEVRKKISLYRA